MSAPVPRATGPCVGDAVAVELRGAIVEIVDHDGVPSALVELRTGERVWVSLDHVTIAQSVQ